MIPEVQLTNQESLDFFFFSSRILGKLFFCYLERYTADAAPLYFLKKTLCSVDAESLSLKI